MQTKKITELERLKTRLPVVVQTPSDDSRYSARSVAAQRKRLKLSAEAFAKLIGVSGQTVYSWEAKHSKPRKTQMQAFMQVRSLSVTDAQERLSALKPAKKAAQNVGTAKTGAKKTKRKYTRR